MEQRGGGGVIQRWVSLKESRVKEGMSFFYLGGPNNTADGT